MNLIIDLGNTCTKISVFNNGQLIHHQVVHRMNDSFFIELKNKFPRLSYTILSSVAQQVDELKPLLAEHFQYVLFFEHNTALPITSAYASPQTLGLDRLAAAVGAWRCKPKQNSLIIDMGTAITIDFLNEQGTFLGGNISPGMNTRFRALHKFTHRLPKLEPIEEWPQIGTDTPSAMRAGVQKGVFFELKGYIDEFRANYKSLTVFLSGGEAFFFAKKFKSIIFAPNLLAEGLNSILEFNMKELE